MPKNTKAQVTIFNTLKDLLEYKSIDSITVKEICSHSGLSRRTFYNSFENKYAVINWHFEHLIQHSLLQAGRTLTWHDAHLMLLKDIKKEAHFYLSAGKSNDYNAISWYARRLTREIYLETLSEYNGVSITDELYFQVDAFALIASCMVAKWGQSGMKVKPERYASYLDTIIPVKLLEVMEKGLK